MVHELVEIGELRKMGRAINRRVIVDSPKAVNYDAHFTAMETELNYALHKKDSFWVKIRSRHHTQILDDDPNLPEQLRSRAEGLLERYRKTLRHRIASECRMNLHALG